jgi:hypothetical protein
MLVAIAVSPQHSQAPYPRSSFHMDSDSPISHPPVRVQALQPQRRANSCSRASRLGLLPASRYGVPSRTRQSSHRK